MKQWSSIWNMMTSVGGLRLHTSDNIRQYRFC